MTTSSDDQSGATANAPLAPDAKIVIAGGGVAGMEAILALRALAPAALAIELVTPTDTFECRPLSVLEPFGLGDTRRFSLAEFAAEQRVALRPATAVRVDPAARRLITAEGDEIAYDALVLAIGTRPVEAVPGAITFGGPASTGEIEQLLADLESGTARRVVFAMPTGPTWPLPLIELALLTGLTLRLREIAGAELTIVSPESHLLQLFGAAASDEIARMAGEVGVEIALDRHAVSFDGTTLHVVPSAEIPADRVVALPRLIGPSFEGVAHNAEGFINTDRFGRVAGAGDVYAAGDATTFPIKQGGIASQQADTVAETIAARAGAELDPQPFRPVLRGVLFTGLTSSYVESEIAGGHGDPGRPKITHGIWWPPDKIVGRFLAPYLSQHPAIGEPEPLPHSTISVETELTGDGHPADDSTER